MDWESRGGCPEVHFILRAGCVGCNAARLLGMNLQEVEDGYEYGTVTLDMRDAYRHVWALSAVRSATYDHWKGLPHEDARPLVEALTKRLGLRIEELDEAA